ncbi:exocyst complex component Sec3-domain-containing protein [Morchella snyderi]|nr:exocyst complex component Sec3-domain-containing protein [Morchella snyderi]
MADPFPRNRPPNAAPPHPSSAGSFTKAQIFEDEKRRITVSCFSRTDTDGSLLESYITHCKVVEDATSPSEPPPPNAPSDQKKERVIIIAVRKSGRVRMHKARENNNATFQIGKTWNLDDLQEIENYSPPNEKGFTVTILKPYYWQANSSKEKDFFISSMLKIFKKYTGGKIPNLIGFERTDIDRMVDGAASLQVRQRQEEEGSRGHTPPNLPTSLSPPLLRNLATAQSMDSLTRSASRQLPGMKGMDGLSPPVGVLRPSQSTDRLPNSSRRAPDPLALGRTTSGRSIASNDSIPPPIPPQGPGRRPSEGSQRSGRQRSNSRSTQDEGGGHRAPSAERMRRTPSSNSHQSREPVEYQPFNGSNSSRVPDLSTTAPDHTGRPQLQSMKSNKDVGSAFRLAATAFSAGNTKFRPQTPTTPTTPAPMSRGPSREPERSAELPQIKFPRDQESVNDVASTDRLEESEDRRSRPRDIPPTQIDPPLKSERRATLTSRDNIIPLREKPRDLSPQPRNQDSLDIPGRRSLSPDGSNLDPNEGNPRSRSRSPNTKGRKRKSAKSSYLDDVDTSRVTVDLEDLLHEFNWDGRGKVDELEASIKKEIATVESTNIIIHSDGDDRVEDLSVLLDKAIKECEEMDALLTLYAVELTSLNDDISHIENQSQGLQVQTANQKTLQKELQSLLETISIVPQQLDTLKCGSLDSAQALEGIEETLLALYKAMATIDPHIASSPVNNGRRGSWSDEGIGTMRALQEKKEGYRAEINAFLARQRQFLAIKFQAEIAALEKHSKGAGVVQSAKPKLLGHDSAYLSIYRFVGLIVFTKDVDREEYMELQKLYMRPAKQLFENEFRDHIFAWKRITRKPAQEETDLVFTVQEKENDNVAVSAARKLTVKRSQTLAKIRSPTGESFSKDKNQDGKIHAYEAFSGALTEMYSLVFREQNFLGEFYHLSSQLPADFVELASNSKPETRRLGDLGGIKPSDQDKMKGRIMLELMGELFSFWLQDLQNLSDWVIKTDPVHCAGVLFAIEEKIDSLEETNQEYLVKTLQKLHDRLAGLFSRFLDEQIKAIEETKVKIKKRKGVITFMKVFPGFSAKIEDQLPPESPNQDDELDVREMVNDGYAKINKAMFESLQAIAKESPAVASQSVDPEDKEQLNYHIMMIENMHHYLEEVDTRSNSILVDFKKKADAEFKEHMGLYISAVIRRPLGKILDFIEGVEVLQRSGTEDISTRHSHSKSVYKKILGNHDGKEIKRGIETLRKRVDKHFGDSDDPALCARLLEKIFDRLEAEYIDTHKRAQKLLLTVYKDQGLELEFMVQDVQTAFRK